MAINLDQSSFNQNDVSSFNEKTKVSQLQAQSMEDQTRLWKHFKFKFHNDPIAGTIEPCLNTIEHGVSTNALIVVLIEPHSIEMIMKSKPRTLIATCDRTSFDHYNVIFVKP
jgi:hydroxyacyl-ACP dehydratase HTD2-like protein with hotdog domain